MRIVPVALIALLGASLLPSPALIAGAHHTPAAPCGFTAPVFAKVWATFAEPGARQLVDIVNASGDPIALAFVLNSGGVTWHLWSGDAATSGHAWLNGSATPTSPAVTVTESSPFDRVCLEIRYVGPGDTSVLQAVSKVSDDNVRPWLDWVT